MCGIAGAFNLADRAPVDAQALARMAAALIHRGPDQQGDWLSPGIGLAARRLSIVGLADGRQPIWNEDRSVVVVFNGELFDYAERRAALTARGHSLRTSGDTEILVHLWEDSGPAMLDHLHGQFALALYDCRQETLFLARDRLGICPLYWSRQGDWLYFGSEIKALLASGAVPAAVDERGIDHAFTFFALPAERTCFAGISALQPGHCLLVGRSHGAPLRPRRWWDLNFPDRGDELDPSRADGPIEQFRHLFGRAVERRLRADVPVVSYLSGGIDSAAVVATACQQRREPIASFTIQLAQARLDESPAAIETARRLGCRPTVLRCDGAQLAAAWPAVIQASDSPVVDAAASALYCLAGEVHRQGFKVALTGEGSDEALAGYPWFKWHKLLGLCDVGDFKPGDAARWLLARAAPRGGWRNYRRIRALTGGPYAQADLYAVVGTARRRFYSARMLERLQGATAFADLELDRKRIARWHPLNQSLYFGYRTMLPGLLLSQRGDRIAMANSVETRYPFLDEELVEFCAQLHPRWKLRGLTQDKYLLRRAMRHVLPPAQTRRRKIMFRAPYGETFFARPPRYVTQLLGAESLERTGYFNVDNVRNAFARFKPDGQGPGLVTSMGLTAVLATQLWHHLYMGGSLCELPSWSASAGVATAG